jgi:hypothetical protein
VPHRSGSSASSRDGTTTGREDEIRARWDKATLAMRRDIVRTLLAVTVNSTRPYARRRVPLTDRITVAWRGTPTTDTGEGIDQAA